MDDQSLTQQEQRLLAKVFAQRIKLKVLRTRCSTTCDEATHKRLTQHIDITEKLVAKLEQELQQLRRVLQVRRQPQKGLPSQEDHRKHVPETTIEQQHVAVSGEDTASGNLTPISLADLGLSEEDIVSIEAVASSTMTDEDEAWGDDVSPFSFADMGLSDEEIAALRHDISTDEVVPFSLEDELTPFSLSDLGLSDEEIAALSFDATTDAQTNNFIDGGDVAPWLRSEDTGSKHESSVPTNDDGSKLPAWLRNTEIPVAPNTTTDATNQAFDWLRALGDDDDTTGFSAPSRDNDTQALHTAANVPYLNTRFDGLAPQQAFPVGRRVPLILWVGDVVASHQGQTSRPFQYTYHPQQPNADFTIQVRGDPEFWVIKSVEPLLKTTAPGRTTQEAEFLITAVKPGREKLYIAVTDPTTGVVFQDIWLTIWAEDEQKPIKPGTVPASQRTEAARPLYGSLPELHTVRITVQQSVVATGYRLFVDAHLPGERVVRDFVLPITGDDLQQATRRLRAELQKVVFSRYHPQPHAKARFPFANNDSITIDDAVARAAYWQLADAGRMVWRLLFAAPRADPALLAFAKRLRELPEGSSIQIVLDNPEFVVPWALLYDSTGFIDAETVDVHRFWGTRYKLDVLVPGVYPDPVFAKQQASLLAAFSDEDPLQHFTDTQRQFLQKQSQQFHSVFKRGALQFRQWLNTVDASDILYCYCHATHTSGMTQPAALAHESSLILSKGQHLRLVDLEDLELARFRHHPVVFLNACEGAALDPFYYNGFMPYFIERRGARAFIGTEVKAPQLLAHDYALHFFSALPTGNDLTTILWQLRRHYLKQHNNILAFNYSLYGQGDARLAGGS